jgi:DNA-binding transcriptional ArsR family regulator
VLVHLSLNLFCVAPSTSALLAATRHPLRRRILQAFLANSLRPISARELAGTIGAPVSRVSYHLKTLAQCEVLSLLEEDEDRGAATHLYGFAPGIDPEWLGLVLEVSAGPGSPG